MTTENTTPVTTAADIEAQAAADAAAVATAAPTAVVDAKIVEADAVSMPAALIDMATDAAPAAFVAPEIPEGEIQKRLADMADKKQIDADSIVPIPGMFYARVIKDDELVPGKELQCDTVDGLAELVAADPEIPDDSEIIVFQDVTAKFMDGTDAGKIRNGALRTTKVQMAAKTHLNLSPARTLDVISQFINDILKVSDLKGVVITMLSESSGLGGFSVFSTTRLMDNQDATMLVNGMRGHSDILKENLVKAGLVVDDETGGIITPGSVKWTPRT